MIAAALAAIYWYWQPWARVEQSAQRPVFTPVEKIREKSLAVLPFANLSDDEQNAFFTDGMHDEILNDLAKIADLKVISRTSVMQYKSGTARNLREIGQQLGVAHVLEGSVRRVGTRVRVTAQLVDARSDTQIWGDQYDRDLADVFAIQSEIAQAIVDQLQAKLSLQERAGLDERPTADLAVALQAAVDAVPELDVGGGETAIRIMLAMIRRDAAAARAILAASPRSDFQEVDFTFYYPRSCTKRSSRGRKATQPVRAQHSRRRGRSSREGSRRNPITPGRLRCWRRSMPGSAARTKRCARPDVRSS